MILGMSWFVSLGEMVVDWKKQTMKIETSQGTKILKGVPRGELLFVSLCGMLGENQGSTKTKLTVNKLKALVKVLTCYENVCQKLINVRPYRCPYC